MEMKIAKATTKQLYAITVLTRKFFPYIDLNIDKILERMRNGVEYYVALCDGHTIGFVDVEFAGEIDEEGRKKREGVKQAKILGLCVSPEFQGKGIGKKLLARALKAAREKKAEQTVMLVAEDNIGAIKLYEKFGFEKKGTLNRKLWDKKILLMTKPLLQTRSPARPSSPPQPRP